MRKFLSKLFRRKTGLVCQSCADRRQLAHLIYNVRGTHICDKCGLAFTVEFK